MLYGIYHTMYYNIMQVIVDLDAIKFDGFFFIPDIRNNNRYIRLG